MSGHRWDIVGVAALLIVLIPLYLEYGEQFIDWLCAIYVQRIKKLPLSGDEEHRLEEIRAVCFPRSAEARRARRRRSCAIDHIVYTCGRLEDGIDTIERLTGVRAVVGGRHLGVGTHNALLSLGAEAYLEIIAPDPTQPEPEQPRPFQLDDPTWHGRIVAFALHPKKSASIELLATSLLLEGEPPGELRAMSRNKPDGSVLNWRLTPLSRASGPRPWLIDWGSTAHPASTSPPGCLLAGLTCIGYEAERMEAVLRKIGLQPLPAKDSFGTTAVVFAPHHNTLGFLVADLDTPKGRVRLGGTRVARRQPLSEGFGDGFA